MDLNQMMVKEVGRMFDDEIQAINTSLNEGMLDDQGMFSKDEFRGLLVGLKLLGIRHHNDLADVSLSSLIKFK